MTLVVGSYFETFILKQKAIDAEVTTFGWICLRSFFWTVLWDKLFIVESTILIWLKTLKQVSATSQLVSSSTHLCCLYKVR